MGDGCSCRDVHEREPKDHLHKAKRRKNYILARLPLVEKKICRLIFKHFLVSQLFWNDIDLVKFVENVFPERCRMLCSVV